MIAVEESGSELATSSCLVSMPHLRGRIIRPIPVSIPALWQYWVSLGRIILSIGTILETVAPPIDRVGWPYPDGAAAGDVGRELDGGRRDAVQPG